jgi:hypothetical protein
MGEERDDPRDRGLIHAGDISPDFLDNALPHLPACDDKRLPFLSIWETVAHYLVQCVVIFRNIPSKGRRAI